MKNLIKTLWKQLVCKHNDLTVAVCFADGKNSYCIRCPDCDLPMIIRIVGYTLTPERGNSLLGCNKKIYHTETDARTVKNWQESHGFVKELRCYYCNKHKGWHLTKVIN